ncbi:5'-AMP-activated protein kinase subunit beta-2 isoform X2 [Lingula anatina]|uniref:5'-AMP-activated protein kinase subunit beta-1 n=1 Tax=Lingula anatina TaxID=7574 RepID=A0A1S3HJ87_LINAN|nr:5'-AMP-activated protein kinase subunit beta-2 isoform X2 [Lingula anatina]|eukprot:XP_013386183.1 5'-AMP-activated protein kinase subunit beta-2 isoform X2 [Lingula anatina]
MGNTGPGGQKRHNSGDDPPSSPGVGRTNRLIYQPSMDESDEFMPGSLRAATLGQDIDLTTRMRADSLSNYVRPNKEIRLPTPFKWEGGGKEVYMSGSFDNWKSKIPMAKSHGDFFVIIDLPEGITEYKFLVDGVWCHDKNEPTTTNNMGTKNNIMKVKKSDFEVFEALKSDAVGTNESKTSMSGSPPGEYCQEVPQRKPNEKVPGPPILPPHLLQVILNKDVPASCEPNLLPEPNHVMLNHLYALSIKDGVMVLSATHRYKKKYVTTLLYKPI